MADLSRPYSDARTQFRSEEGTTIDSPCRPSHTQNADLQETFSTDCFAKPSTDFLAKFSQSKAPEAECLMARMQGSHAATQAMRDSLTPNPDPTRKQPTNTPPKSFLKPPFEQSNSDTMNSKPLDNIQDPPLTSFNPSGPDSTPWTSIPHTNPNMANSSIDHKAFERWEPKIEDLPPSNLAYGTKPYPDSQGPQPRPGSPPARTSNAATKVPMWEDRKWKFKLGGRFQKTFYDDEYLEFLGKDTTETAHLDQEDNLIIPLIDMRPVSPGNSTPRRVPVYYMYEKGKPRDWNDNLTIQILNDRRRAGIRRITQDPLWTSNEREYLKDLLVEYPDASITEIAERFNYRFAGDFKEPQAFEYHDKYECRTLESVRAEYLEHKPLYDRAIVPCPKPQEGINALNIHGDLVEENLEDRKNLFWKFHRPDVDQKSGKPTLQAMELFKTIFGRKAGELEIPYQSNEPVQSPPHNPHIDRVEVANLGDAQVDGTPLALQQKDGDSTDSFDRALLHLTTYYTSDAGRTFDPSERSDSANDPCICHPGATMSSDDG